MTVTQHSAVAQRPMDIASLPSITLDGARIHAITQAECVQVVLNELEAGRGGWIVTLNLHHLRCFVRQPDYAQTIQQATLVVADGMPLVWASRVQGRPLLERVPGCELIWSLSAAAAASGRSVFLLGGNPGTAERTATILQASYPDLRLAGTLCPEMGFEKDAAQVAQVREALLSAAPDIVFVALGTPKEDYWIAATSHNLPAAWWLGVGSGFSFASGEARRAPLWMQRLGLEWLHRLMLDPRRLGRRYLMEGVPFAVALFGRTLKQRLAREKPVQLSGPEE